MEQKIKDYARKKYPTRFTKTTVVRDARGKVTARKEEDLQLFVEERENHFMVYAKDVSPIFLNKKSNYDI